MRSSNPLLEEQHLNPNQGESKERSSTYTIDIDLPEAFDWRDHIKLSDPKEQDTCGSCWAFATTGVLESQYYIKNKQLVNLSEQQLIDCDTNNDGCRGGIMTEAYKFIKASGGIMKTEDYGSYLNIKELCHFQKEDAVVKVKEFHLIDQNETAIQYELVKKGPIAIGLDGRFLQLYTSGIHNPEDCQNSINHAVLIVGYGRENGVPYWIIKNQWGKQWGEDGYFRLKRGENKCGIIIYASIAEIE